MRYWDTSTLAKLYVGEPDSAVFLAHLATADLAAVDKVVVTDSGFRKAARAIGLKVFP